jgi:hypothetical protein
LMKDVPEKYITRKWQKRDISFLYHH